MLGTTTPNSEYTCMAAKGFLYLFVSGLLSFPTEYRLNCGIVFLQKIAIDRPTAWYTNLKMLCLSCKLGNPDGDFRGVPQFFQANSLTVS